MKQQRLLIVMVSCTMMLLFAPLLTTALECPTCGISDLCSSLEWADCSGCSCKCKTDFECGPGEICSEIDTGMFPCFGDDCPRSCTSSPDSILSPGPPPDADMAAVGIGAGVTTTDDADSDDSSTSSQDNGGETCAKSCDTSSLCSFKCIRYPQAECRTDACKCEAIFVDENGNEPDCFGGSPATDDDAPDDDWLPSLPEENASNNDKDNKGDVVNDVIKTTATPPSSSAVDDVEKAASDADDNDVTEDRRKNSVFHQVIIPTFLVVVVIVVAFLIWKGYGKWMRRNAKNKQLRDDKKAAAATADLEESSRPLNRPTPADANV